MFYQQSTFFDCTELKCQFCGFEGTKDDFELDFINKNSFWCPDCGGHTLLIKKITIKEVHFYVILEERQIN